MKKKLFILLSLFFLVVLTGASATACVKESNPNSTPESSFDSSVDMTTTLTLSADSLDLDLYESATLTATLNNSEEPIIWSSSDESIVKVVDGVVTAYKTGSATITAKAGEVAKSCVVTVGEMGVFAFSGLQESVDLMKGSSMPLDLTLTYNDVDFTMAEISVQPEGNGLSYVDEMLIAVEYGTQNLVITATVNGTVVHTHTMVVTVFESGSIDVELEDGEIALKIGGEGFAISNFKAMVNGLLLENPEFTFEFETEGFVKVEDGMICPVAEGSTTATVCFTTTQNTYNRIVFIKVYKEAINLGNVLAKGDAGKTVQNIGLAAIDLSEKEIALQDVEKVLINGKETTAYTIEGNVITFINPNGGSNEIVLETAMAKYNLDACFYGHSISTLAELEEWRTGNIAAYTILLKDIDCEGETLAVIESGYKSGQLDGLGHTVCNFVLKKGFIHGIDATGAIRNIQFVNFIQDCSSAGAGAVGFGVLATDNAGTIENVLLKGKLINVPNADHYGLLYKGALEGSVCQNVFAELTSDGVGMHYTGPMWRVDTGNYILSNVAYVFNGNVYNSDYNPTQVTVYVTMEEFAQNMDATLWNGWTMEEGKFFLSNYDNARCSVYSFGEATLGESISIHSSGFEPIVCEVVEGAEFVTVEGNVLTILMTANAGENIRVAVKDENGNVLDTFEYTITLEASLFAKGKALVGETVEFIITSTLPDEMFTIEVLEGEEFGTLNGRMFTIKEDAEVGSIIRIKVSCSADANWGDVFDFVVSREEIIGESLFNPSSGYEGSATDEVAVPEGFENVYKYSGTDEYIHGGHYLAENLDDYSLVTFAIKAPKIRLDSYGWEESNEWLVFTLMQTDTAVWSLEVFKDGEIIHTDSGLSGNRNDGAYRYNALNSILFGVPNTGYYFNAVNGVMTAYFTEVRGITSAVEVPVEPIEPVGTIIQDCVYDEAGAGFTVSDEIAVAPGFERLYKHASNAEFIHGLNFSGVNLDNYSLVTFAIKTANFNMNSEGANTSNEWLVFTLTQVSPDTWDLVVTQNGETVYTKAGLKGAYTTNDAYTDNALDAILYGNPTGFSPTGVDGNLLIYVTELRGVETPIKPVGTIIQDCVFDITDFNTGTSFVASTEIATANGFEKLYKYENAGQEALHGGNWSGVNLDNYSVVTFAIKTAKFNFNNESNDTSNTWLVFTLTQTDTAVWTLVVTKNGEVVYEKAGLSGNRETGGAYVYNALDAILYGVPSQGYTAWGVDGNLLIYVTELRGVLA